MRRPLGTVQPLDVPQPAPDLLLLQLLLRLLLLPRGLEPELSPLVLRVDRAGARAARAAVRRRRGRAADRARAGPTVLEAIERDGQVAAVRDAAVGHEPLLRAQRADELVVVRDHHHAAAEVADGDGQPAERVAVQVVGRLVQHEQVRVVPHGARQHHLHLLPARQPRDLVVVGDFRVQADVLEVFGDYLGGELAEAEPFARSFVVVEFLD